MFSPWWATMRLEDEHSWFAFCWRGCSLSLLSFARVNLENRNNWLCTIIQLQILLKSSFLPIISAGLQYCSKGASKGISLERGGVHKKKIGGWNLLNHLPSKKGLPLIWLVNTLKIGIKMCDPSKHISTCGACACVYSKCCWWLTIGGCSRRFISSAGSPLIFLQVALQVHPTAVLYESVL